MARRRAVATAAGVNGTAGTATQFAPAQNADTLALRDIDFRRGPDGAGRIIVSLPSTQVGVDIRQQGQTLVVEFLRSQLPDNLRRRLDVCRLRHAGADHLYLSERRPGAHGRHAHRILGTQCLSK